MPWLIRVYCRVINLQGWQPTLRQAKSIKARSWTEPETFPLRSDEEGFDLSL